ncbi:hypothetical protein D3C85_1215980 [compost metagenome]
MNGCHASAHSVNTAAEAGADRVMAASANSLRNMHDSPAMATSLKRNSMTHGWPRPLAAKPACAQRAALSGCNSQSAAAALCSAVVSSSGNTAWQPSSSMAISVQPSITACAPAACSAAMMSR